MALNSKRAGNIHSKSGSSKAKLQAKFDENYHDVISDNPDDNPILASLIYTIQNLSEDIDSLRTFTDTELKGLINTNTAKTGISTAQANAITANSAKTGISDDQANAITTNSNKTDGRYLYLPKTANFNADISSGLVYVPLSDGETEGTSTTRRTVFISPCDGQVHKVHIRSNGSLLSSGRAATLQIKAWSAADGRSTLTELESENVETVAGNTAMVATFSSSSAFRVGEQVHISMQLTDRVPTGAKNYYVTVVFKLDQNSM